MTSDGLKDVSLSEFLGKENVVVYFFPAAFTSVCTLEMCDVSGGIGNFKKLGAKVLGISCDSPFSQDAWAKQNKIDVTLLSDYSHKVTREYGVELPDLMGLGPASARAAFVIDKEGKIIYSEQTPTPKDLPNFEAIEASLS